MNRGIHSLMYRLLQYIRREPVFEVWNSLQKSQWYGISELNNIQTTKLENLVEFAKANVTFYSNRINETMEVWDAFNQIQPLRKGEIRDKREEIITKNINIPFTMATTAGTTGVPLSIPVSNVSWAYHHANILRILGWHGIHPLERQARIWGRGIDTESKIKMFLKDFIFNRIRLSVFSISEENCRNFYYRMKNSSTHYLYGYATALSEFAHILDRLNLSGKQLELKAIFNTSEVLEEEDKFFLDNFFKCKVVNIYGSAEVGIIASDCDHGKMHIPIESIVVETIPNENDHKEGERILVTDLHNYKMPIIRYDIGDMVILGRDGKCSCGRSLPILKKLFGRSPTIFEIDGKKIHSALFNYIMKSVFHSHGRLRQFLVVREKERDFSVYLSTDKPPTKEEINRFKSLLQIHISTGIKVSFNTVSEIPRNVATGKMDTFRDAYRNYYN